MEKQHQLKVTTLRLLAVEKAYCAPETNPATSAMKKPIEGK